MKKQIHESFPYRPAVRVDMEQLHHVVWAIVGELVADIQGAKQGMEEEASGLEQVRLATYAALEDARQQGQDVVEDVSWCDGIRVPLVSALSDEPAWYLTISLNARVR